MRQKAAREEAREQELAMIKAAKEKEIARLRAQQQRAQDKQALMDEMQAIRIQEEVGRYVIIQEFCVSIFIDRWKDLGGRRRNRQPLRRLKISKPCMRPGAGKYRTLGQLRLSP